MDIFVTTDPTVRPLNKTSAMWVGSNYGFDIVTINKQDRNYGGAGTTYYVGVQGLAPVNKLFTIVVTVENDYTRIMEGVPMATQTEPGQFRYFTFDVPSDYAGHRVTFSALSLKSGSDPDLYITQNITTGPPGPSNSRWTSEYVGNDILEIDNAPVGKYYIGVSAYAVTSFFQITATTEFESTLLTAGERIQGHVTQGQHVYYRYKNENFRENFQIVASPSEGSIELYESKSAPNPDETKYERKGTATEVESDRLITHGAYEDYSPHWYYWTVKGTQNSNFSVTVTSEYSITNLQDGRSTYYQYVANKHYKYFVFTIDDSALIDPRSAIAFSVSVLNGDADLFVSVTNIHPTAEDYQWKSDNIKSDTVTIYADDPNIMGNRTFYIGVYGATARGSDTSFSILAHTTSSTIQIRENMPIVSQVEYEKYVYLEYKVNERGYRGPIDVTFNVPNPDKRVVVFADTGDNHRPSVEHYQWKSSTLGQTKLSIPDAHDGTYYFGVLGWKLSRNMTDRMIDFSVTITRPFEVLNANSGGVLRSLNENNSTRYRFTILDDDYVAVSLTMVRGRARLYMNAATNATNDAVITDSANAYYKSESPNGNVIIVRKLNVGPWVQTWNAIVYADENSHYYISVSTSTAIRAEKDVFSTALVDLHVGLPMLQKSAFQDRFVYSVVLPYVADAQKEDYYISLRILDDKISLYASQDYTVIPNPHNYIFKAEHIDSDTVITLEKEKLDQSQMWGGRLFISIYGDNFAMLQDNTFFEITVYTASSPIILVQDQALPQTIKTSESYSLYHVKGSTAYSGYMDVVVESCDDLPAQVPKVFGSTSNTTPTEENKAYNSEPVGKFKQIMKSDALPQDDSTLYVSVQHKQDTARTYAIYTTSDTNSLPIITDYKIAGQPDNDGTFTFTLTAAKHHIHEKGFNYKMYSREISVTNADKINFVSVCAITRFGSIQYATQEFNESSSIMDLSAGPFDGTKLFVINVIVGAENTLVAAYEPVYVIYGQFYATWPSVLPTSTAGPTSTQGPDSTQAPTATPTPSTTAVPMDYNVYLPVIAIIGAIVLLIAGVAALYLWYKRRRTAHEPFSRMDDLELQGEEPDAGLLDEEEDNEHK
jgi:hypothetical protein